MSSPKEMKIISFTGRKERFWQWKQRYLGIAQSRGYLSILIKDDPNTIAKEADIGTGTGRPDDELRREIELNLKAYTDLRVAMEDRSCLRVVMRSTSTDYPQGNAALAWKNIAKRFEDRSESAKERLKEELHSKEKKIL